MKAANPISKEVLERAGSQPEMSRHLTRHSRESGNPEAAWIPGRASLARNDEAEDCH